MPTAQLNPLQQSQIPELLGMIKALGQSDGLTNIQIDEAAIQANILCENPVAFAKFIHFEGKNVGFILHSWKWSPFSGCKEVYMQCIYLKPEFQSLGLGKQAMNLLSNWAREQGSTKIEWLVIKDNQQANRFYDSIGSVSQQQLRLRRLTL